jgi:hypothetical protein
VGEARDELMSRLAASRLINRVPLHIYWHQAIASVCLLAGGLF